MGTGFETGEMLCVCGSGYPWQTCPNKGSEDCFSYEEEDCSSYEEDVLTEPKKVLELGALGKALPRPTAYVREDDYFNRGY